MSVTVDSAKKLIGPGIALAGVVIVSSLLYDCGKRSAQNQVADLTTKLAESEKTVQLKDGLYATKIVEESNIQNLLDGSRKEVEALKKQLSDSQAQLLTTQQVALKWKQAYEASLKSQQSDGGKGTGPDGQPTERKRVDFAGDLGPIHATGHTLTDPPESYLKLDQTRPLILTVSVAKNKDGQWQSYVTSSEPNIDAQVNLGGVDPGVTSPTWRERIWLDVGFAAIGGQGGQVGLSYHFDRWSLGAFCMAYPGGDACGVSAGFRLFK